MAVTSIFPGAHSCYSAHAYDCSIAHGNIVADTDVAADANSSANGYITSSTNGDATAHGYTTTDSNGNSAAYSSTH